MTKSEIIRMAREAGVADGIELPHEITSIELFAALVAEAERNRTWTQNHWTEYEKGIAESEREACAQVCEPQSDHDDPLTAFKIASAIRARGQHDT